MPKKMSVSEEIYTHKYLWRAANFLLEEAKLNERRSHYFLLSSLFMAYAAFEAFINFSGYILLPAIWSEEKKHFKGQGDSTEKKISKLLKVLTDLEWKKGERPYQTIRKIRRFRNIVAHGKVKSSQYETVSSGDTDMSYIKWKHDWDSFISIKEVENSIHDIK